MDTQHRADRVREYARQTNGSAHTHKHFTGQLVYTDGIQFLAATCEAYWLIDLVASYQFEIAKTEQNHQLRDFQVWRVWVIADGLEDDGSWVIDAWSDIPEALTSDEGPASVLLARQVVGFSDFPQELCHVGVVDPGRRGFQFWVEHGTMMLKEER